ncbi:MAG: HisA/HisF-related TIM barrel protein, partial [Pseudomonadota bacterium]|nr:HisA/HisF-related TIM barrel protein [Pseudomonadota bacterium]
MRGHVVHARQGDRARYRPLHSKLSNSSQPQEVVNALMRLHAFRTLYIADLDAILGRGDNSPHIRSIGRDHPDLDLWIDAGLRDDRAISHWRRTGARYHPVIGSESLSSVHCLRHPVFDPTRYVILSLDFQGDTFLGPPQLATTPSLWPQRVILMMLERVGSNQGPELERLQRFAARSPTTAWYVGGGVRGAHDLQALAAIGASGALVASALHAQVIDASTLA